MQVHFLSHAMHTAGGTLRLIYRDFGDTRLQSPASLLSCPSCLNAVPGPGSPSSGLSLVLCPIAAGDTEKKGGRFLWLFLFPLFSAGHTAHCTWFKHEILKWAGGFHPAGFVHSGDVQVLHRSTAGSLQRRHLPYHEETTREKCRDFTAGL